MNISLLQAKRLAEEDALRKVSALLKAGELKALDARYLEAEFCWMFFLNRRIDWPKEATIRFAYVISRKGTRIRVNDYRGRPEKIYEALWGTSDNFGRTEFGVERMTVPTIPSRNPILPQGWKLDWKKMPDSE